MFVPRLLHPFPIGQRAELLVQIEIWNEPAQRDQHRFAGHARQLDFPAWGIRRDTNPKISRLARGQGATGSADERNIDYWNGKTRAYASGQDGVGSVCRETVVEDTDEIGSRFQGP